MEKGNLVPIHSLKESAEVYRKSAAWKRFASQLPKHPFIRDRLGLRDGPVGCAWCGQSFKRIENAQVHHTDYNNFCSYPLTKTIPCPTPKRPNRVRSLPDCEGCYYDNRSGFDECVTRVVLIHGYCNLRIEEARRSMAGS